MQPEILDTTFVNVDISDIEALIADNKAELSKATQMISRYRQEKETNNDYKGRQLLELIQNADDAGSNYVKIIINTATCTLQVINTGNPFSLEGFRSLMIPNLSPKRKKSYIGNKGLGFRSVLNWSETVAVISAGVKVRFSKELAKLRFDELYTAEEQVKLLKEFKYKSSVVPFPIFATPSVDKADTNPGETIIDIQYLLKEQEDIIDQIDALHPEVLLFLNHISHIEILKDGRHTEFKCTKSGNTVKIGDKSWTLFNNENDQGEDPELPEIYRDSETALEAETETDEVESYSLKIAVQHDLSDHVYKLFTFFPTKVGLHFPAVIHGTFELDSSRNRIVSSDKNKFLVKELLELMFKVCNEFESQALSSGWNKMRFLNYKGQKDTVLTEFGFYKTIDDRLRLLSILPTLDSGYRNYFNTIYISDTFSQLIEDLSQERHFPELLKPVPDDLREYFGHLFPDHKTRNNYNDDTLKKKIEGASIDMYKLLPAITYAKWIIGIEVLYNNKTPTQLTVLYNETGDLISSNNTLFTPQTKNAQIEVPPHVPIQYLNTTLYNNLAAQYNLSPEERPRRLKDRLERFVNIQSFEPAPVLTRVITATNTAINKPELNQDNKVLVRAMLKCLYDYYIFSNRAKESQIRTSRIPVLSAAGNIIMAQDSFLSESYATGVIRSKLLGYLYSKDELIASPLELGFENTQDTEKFLVDFLGVQRFVNLERLEERPNYDPKYADYVFQRKTKPDRFRAARLNYTNIRNLDAIRKVLSEGHLKRESLLAWICIDQEIREKLESTSDTDFNYNTVNQAATNWQAKIYDVPSYIKFQLSRLAELQDYVLENDNIPFLNSIQIDFKAPVFVENNIDVATVREILKQLGAKADFNELGMPRITALLKSLPELDKAGKYARKVYLLCTDRFKEKNQPIQDKRELKLHATQDNKRGYFPYADVYYAKNIGLPRKITSEKPMLNYPKRSAEQKVVDFFAVQAFDDIIFTAGKHTVNSMAAEEMSAYLKQLRPYILLRRLGPRVKSKDEIRDAYRTVKKLRIILCSELWYDINGVTREADTYDFVSDKNHRLTYYIRYNGNPGIDALKRDSDMSDVISEIYSIAFDLSNITEEIRILFRNDFKDTQRHLTQEFGEEELDAIKSKLEVTDAERIFWVAIYQLTQTKAIFPGIDDEQDFQNAIANALQLDKTVIQRIDFENLSSKDNQIALHTVFSSLNLSLSTFNVAHSPLSFYEFHRQNLTTLTERLNARIRYALWMHLCNCSSPDKRTFITRLPILINEIVEQVAGERKFEVIIDYRTEAVNSIRLSEGFAVDLTLPLNTEYQKVYSENRQKLNTTDNQLNRLDDGDRSLVYFQLSEAEFSEIAELLRQRSLEPANINELPEGGQGSESNEPSKPISDLEGSTNGMPGNGRGVKKKGNHGSNSGRHPGQDAANSALGKKAEKDVLAALKFRFVEWVSEYSDHPDKWDGWGYDIRCKQDEADEWTFIEVKWFGKESFFLTANEFDVARENKQRYYLYLVNDNNIKKVLFDELLNDANEFNHLNKYFSYEISEYKFSKLKNSK
jgi:hypothetical protein